MDFGSYNSTTELGEMPSLEELKEKAANAFRTVCLFVHHSKMVEMIPFQMSNVVSVIGTIISALSLPYLFISPFMWSMFYVKR